MNEHPIVVSDTVIEAAARAAHEVNRAYCIALGDFSQPPWEDAPEWQRRSAMVGARGVLVDGNWPRESHACWLREKTAEGWKYGPVKDPEKKEHPCFVPYDDLPPAQRRKDDLFVTTVRAIGRALGAIVATHADDFASTLERWGKARHDADDVQIGYKARQQAASTARVCYEQLAATADRLAAERRA